jgi:integrase
MTSMGRKRKGQITQVEENRFQIRVQTGVDGKRSSHFETFDGSAEEAQTYLDNLLDQIAEIEKNPEKFLTVNQALDDWLAGYVKFNVKRRTLQGYQDVLRRYVRPAFGDKLLVHVKPTDLQYLYNKMNLEGYSPVTIRKPHMILHACFDYFYNLEVLSRNPADAVRPPKGGAKEITIPTREELRMIFDSCRNPKEKALWNLVAFTGARPEEYLAMRWSDVDLNKAVWSITQVQVELPEGVIIYEEPKTEKSKRSLPLTEETIELLKAHRRVQLEYQLKIRRWTNNNLVFPSRFGTPMRGSNLYRHFKSLLEVAGISTEENPSLITPYSLRHSFATYSLEAGANLKDVSTMLGHSSIRITADTYAHTSDERKVFVVNAFAETLSGTKLKKAQ